MKECIGKSCWELYSLNSIQEWLEDDDEDDYLDIDMLLLETLTQTGNSRSKRKRKETDNEDETDSQQGEDSLNSTRDGDSEDETDSDVIDGDSEDESKLEIQDKMENVKRKRLEIYVARTEILEKKNKVMEEILHQKKKVMEEMLEREYASSIERAIEILNELRGVRMWSPFYEASLNHLLADVANRQGFFSVF